MSGDLPPKKPREGMPCNGCGLCCALEVCDVGRIAYGDAQEAPCPALVWSAGRSWCGLVVAEKAKGMEPAIATTIGIGTSCDSSDDPALEEWGTEAMRRTRSG